MADDAAPSQQTVVQPGLRQFVTDQDLAKYGEFARYHLTGLANIRQVKGKSLHHYTTGDALIKIVESGKLWATQVSNVNDARELTYAVKVFRQVIRKRAGENITQDLKVLYQSLDQLTRHVTTESQNVFITSFSERKNDLSQWRAYGGASGGGYSIEFNTDALRQAAAKCKAILVPVSYGKKDTTTLFSDVIKWSENFFRQGLQEKKPSSVKEWADEFSQHWLEMISYLAPFIKHPAFSKEREWRIIRFAVPLEELRALKFVQRSSMMTKHLPLTLGDERDDKYTPLPLSGVMVGPTIHPRHTKISVGDLLVSKGYPANVSYSKTPFRSLG